MAFRCWLCKAGFEQKKYLQIHMIFFHRRLAVVCPFCRVKYKTLDNTDVLKDHCFKIHTESACELPRDFFSNNNCYYLAVHPEDYRRVVTPASPDSKSAAIAMKLIKDMLKALPQPSPKGLDEWNDQWKAALETPDKPADSENISTSLDRSNKAKGTDIPGFGSEKADKKTTSACKLSESKIVKSGSKMNESKGMNLRSRLDESRTETLASEETANTDSRFGENKKLNSGPQLDKDKEANTSLKCNGTQLVNSGSTLDKGKITNYGSHLDEEKRKTCSGPNLDKNKRTHAGSRLDEIKLTNSSRKVDESKGGPASSMAETRSNNGTKLHKIKTVKPGSRMKTRFNSVTRLNYIRRVNSIPKSNKGKGMTSISKMKTRLSSGTRLDYSELVNSGDKIMNSVSKMETRLKSGTMLDENKRVNFGYKHGQTKRANGDSKTYDNNRVDSGAKAGVSSLVRKKCSVPVTPAELAELVSTCPVSVDEHVGTRSWTKRTEAPVYDESDNASETSQTSVSTDSTSSSKSRTSVRSGRSTSNVSTKSANRSAKTQTPISKDNRNDLAKVTKYQKPLSACGTHMSGKSSSYPTATAWDIRRTATSPSQLSTGKAHMSRNSTLSPTVVSWDIRNIFASFSELQTPVENGILSTTATTGTPVSLSSTVSVSTMTTTPQTIVSTIFGNVSAAMCQVSSSANTVATPAVTSPNTVATPAMTSANTATSTAVLPTVLTPPTTPIPTCATVPVHVSNTETRKRPHDDGGMESASTKHAKIMKPTYYMCITCGRQFSKPSTLRIHKRIHTRAKMFRCAKCSKRFLYLSSYSVHLISAHGSGSIHKATSKPTSKTTADLATRHRCTVCFGIFPTADMLKQHKVVHEIQNKAVHEQQNKVVPRNRSREVHGKRTGNKTSKKPAPPVKSYKCDKCSVSFVDKNRLLFHKLVHSEPHLPCPVCNKLFRRISSMKIHTLKDHRISMDTLAREGNEKAKLLLKVRQRVPRPAMCKICGTRYETFERLAKHAETHRVSIEPVRYPCSHCNNAFGEKTMLVEHMKTVHGASSSTLLAQVLQSPADKNINDENGIQAASSADRDRYICDFCGARYIKRYNLTRHIMSHLSGPEKGTAAIYARKSGLRYGSGRLVQFPDTSYMEANPFRGRKGYGKLGIPICDTSDVKTEWFGETVKNVANGKVIYRCKVCYLNFLQQSQLKRHINNEIEYHCQRFLKRVSDLVYANLPRKDQKKYKPCEFCGAFYVSERSLNHHKYRFHSNKYKNPTAVSPDTSTKETGENTSQRENAQRQNKANPVIEVVRGFEIEIDNPTDEDADTQYQDSDDTVVFTDSDTSDFTPTICKVAGSHSVLNDPCIHGVRTANAAVQRDVTQAESNCVDPGSDIQHFPKAEFKSELAKSNQTCQEPATATVPACEKVSRLHADSAVVDIGVIQEQKGPPVLVKEVIEVIDLESEVDSTVKNVQDMGLSTVQQHEDVNRITEPESTVDSTVHTIVESILSSEQGLEEMKPIVIDDTDEAPDVKSPIKANEVPVSNSDTVTQPGYIVEKLAPVKGFIEDTDSNDLNSSDEEDIFEDDVAMSPRPDSTENPDISVEVGVACIQCQKPFHKQHVGVGCHLCCKRFCLQCSQLPKRVYKAFHGPQVGLFWMCQVCRPAFPSFMALLRQLAEFEDVLNNRLTGVSQRISGIESKVVETMENSKGDSKPRL